MTDEEREDLRRRCKAAFAGRAEEDDWRERWRKDVEALLADVDALRHGAARLRAEVERLKAGRFTGEEFQNLCHAFSADDPAGFEAGCREYWGKLFGNDNAD